MSERRKFENQKPIKSINHLSHMLIRNPFQLRGGQFAGTVPQIHGALRTPRSRRVLFAQVGSFAGQLQSDLENR